MLMDCPRGRHILTVGCFSLSTLVGPRALILLIDRIDTDI